MAVSQNMSGLRNTKAVRRARSSNFCRGQEAQPTSARTLTERLRRQRDNAGFHGRYWGDPAGTTTTAPSACAASWRRTNNRRCHLPWGWGGHCLWWCQILSVRSRCWWKRVCRVGLFDQRS
jgi:hypothetical protein